MTDEQAVEMLTKVAAHFGWQISFCGDGADDEQIQGILMGTKDYINGVLGHTPCSHEWPKEGGLVCLKCGRETNFDK